MDRITLTVGGDAREYLLFAPSGRAAGVSRLFDEHNSRLFDEHNSRLTPAARQERPLVIFLHGAGGTAAWADGETGWSALAAREGFALALPEGLPPHRDKPPKFLTNPQRWNSEEMRNAECGMRNESTDAALLPSIPHSAFRIPHSPNDVAFLASVIDDAANRADIDRGRVYVSGFSNGAGMAFRAAAELADRVAAVAPVAGDCRIADPKPARPVPTLYILGTADPLVPPRGGDVRSPWLHRLVRRPPVSDSLERWAAALGCSPVPLVESDADGVRMDVYPGPVEFRTLLIDGLGHHWPGGKGQLSHKIGGPPSGQIDGTAAVWEFFRRHRV